MRKPDYREDIDALRGVSVALVVLFHAFPDLVPGGFIGVDVFFVISGYLITSIMMLSLQAESFSLLEFYGRRIRRIFPSMIVVLVFCLLVGWLILYPEEYEQLGRHVKSAAFFLLNFVLINEVGYFDVAAVYKPLLHFWTLSIEEQYYLFWPFLLLCYLKVSSKPVLFFSVLLALSFGLNIYFVFDYPEETFFHTATRLWQLATGSLLAAVMLNRRFRPRRWLFFTGIAFILVSSMLLTGEDSYPGYWALIPTAGAAFIILANASFPTYLGLSRLGLISYPLYLWHWVLISFVYIYIGRPPGNAGTALIVAASVVISYMTYRFVEPLRYRRRVVAGLLLSVVAVGALGYWVERNEGLPARSTIAYYQQSGLQFTRTPHVDDACSGYVASRLPNEREFYYCRASHLQSEKLIAVIGDSHAHVWFPGLAKVARRHGYGTLLLANSSCPPFPGFEWGRNEQDREKCQASIDQIISLVTSEERIHLVALATRGPVYIHGETAAPFTAASVDEALSRESSPLLSYETYSMGFQALLERLGAARHVKRVYYLLENPELDFLPKEVIPRPFDFLRQSSSRNYVDRNLYMRRMAEYRRAIEDLEHPKLTVLDPAAALCDDERCYSFIDGNFVYADDDHFSIFGSELISEYFEKEMFTNGDRVD